MTFGEQIKKYRKENRITQNDLADKLKITRQYLSHLENDKAQPSELLEDKITSLMSEDSKKTKAKIRDVSLSKDVKSIYKNKIIEDMKSLGTYKAEFEQMVDIYADLLVQYRDTLQQCRHDKEEHDEYMLETGRKPPMILIMENLRKDIITYSDRLVLTPKSIQGLVSDERPKSKLEEMLSNFG